MSEMNSVESVFRLMHALKRHLDHDLEAKQLGVVPMQMRVLKIINSRQNCTANDVVQFLKRDKAQVTRLISGLITQGLIRKEPNPDDKRSQLLVLTEHGVKVHKLLAQELASLHDIVVEGLDVKEIEQFQTLSLKMTKNLESSLKTDK
ncbi:MAG: MarR family transcriptional regulator [Bermanella sp.]